MINHSAMAPLCEKSQGHPPWLFSYSWEQRKLGEVLIGLQNNTLSRAELTSEQGVALNVHYGDVLIKFGEYLDVKKEALPMVMDSSIVAKYKASFLQNGDIIVADTAEDETVGKCSEIAGLTNETAISGLHTIPYRPQFRFASGFLGYYMNSNSYHHQLLPLMQGIKVTSISKSAMQNTSICYPKTEDEQAEISGFFRNLDHLIALHQRKYKKTGGTIMLSETTRSDLFCFYYAQWIRVYKEGAVRKVTMDKYLMTQAWLEKLVPTLRLNEVSRITYQQLLNDYAVYHERQTTMDFHHQLKGAIMDAVDDGFIEKDPTRKAIIKGKTPSVKKIKYLNQFELHTLLNSLNLHGEINWDWFIALTAKTGMRFSEVLALTPKDFDFAHQTLSICKTWDYKGDGGFLPTKNKSSVRKIQLDWQTVIQFSELTKALSQEKPIFVNKENVYNSTVNDILARHCKKAKIPVITVHGLRHTHASLLLFAGVSIASVARRLGHASMTTTQKTYLHIIQELENQDIDLVMRSLSGLN